MKHPIQLSIALLFAGISASAQNFNPVVEVTNTYEQAATGIEKPIQQIALPDSLLKFNLDMDYEVRTTPYRGAYEFNPYLVQLRPEPRLTGEGTLFLRLGAGYGLHPEVDAVWTALRKDNLRLNVYADHRGYFGNYRSIAKDGDYFKDNGTLVGGADAATDVGVNGLYGWQTGSLTADLHYRNLYASDAWQEMAHHIASFQARVQSAPQTDFYYNLGTRLSRLMRSSFNETRIQADGGFGANLRRSQLRLDFMAESVFAVDGSAGQVAVIPRYVFQIGSLHLNLGLKAAFTYRSDEYYYPSQGGHVFPDVYVDYQVVPEDFILQASATGGNIMDTYGSLLEQNHFLASFMPVDFDFGIERVNLAVGARGNLARRVHYDAKIGYAYMENALLWGYGYETERGSVPSLGRTSYNLFYASLDAGWKSERIDADVRLKYQSAGIQETKLFAPPAFTAGVDFLYNWGGRIKAGVNLDAATERVAKLSLGESAPEGKLPGYADLGLYGEYGFTRKFAAWLKVGNLLNMEVQRTPFHAEKGIYFSVGATYRF